MSIFAAVLASLLLPQPEVFPRWPVLVLTLVALAMLPAFRHRLDDQWERVGPWIALAYTAGLVLLTGGSESLYIDLIAIVIAITALVRTARRTAIVVTAATVVALLPALLEPVPSHYLTDVVIDIVVWGGLGILILQQSQGLRDHAARLAEEKRETERLLVQEHRVTEALRELRDTRATFTRNVTHEMRTPLTILRGHLQLIESGLVPPDEMPTVIGAMRRGYDRLEKLLVRVEGIYSLTDEALKREEVAVTDLVRRAMGVQARRPDRIDLPSDETTATVDASVAIATISELFANVAQHAGPDAPTRLRVAQEGGSLVIEVADGGSGWAHPEPQELLAPFAQAPVAASRANPGIGLGLAYVVAAARAHGGEVRVDTDPELGGARVRVHLRG